MLDFGFYNMDCLEGMKEFPDNYFELAIVDPPYGCGFSDNGGGGWFTKYHPTERGVGTGLEDDLTNISTRRVNRGVAREGQISSRRHHQYKNCRQPDGSWGYAKWRGTDPDKKIITWDVAPKQEYFEELFRVSRNQIIWGGNYFLLPPTRCFVIWKKLTISENFSMAMCEYAWTSFDDNAKIFEHAPQDPERFHPTQKPVALYTWLLNRYAKEGDKILDTHAGSASSLVACQRGGFKYVGFEIDPIYYTKAKERLDLESKQISIFEM